MYQPSFSTTCAQGPAKLSTILSASVNAFKQCNGQISDEHQHSVWLTATCILRWVSWRKRAARLTLAHFWSEAESQNTATPLWRQWFYGRWPSREARLSCLTVALLRACELQQWGFAFKAPPSPAATGSVIVLWMYIGRLIVHVDAHVLTQPIRMSTVDQTGAGGCCQAGDDHGA